MFRLARPPDFSLPARMISWLRGSARPRCGLFIVLVLLAGFVETAGAANAKARTSEKSGPSFRGAVVIDAASGRVLVEDRADEATPPASMTKLMTYAVLHDRLKSGELTLDTQVQIDRSDAGMGGTQVFLDPRESFSVEELIFAMMIQSANDASHALARVAAGSVPGFVELMNAKARELGMTRTTFRSPHGLPPRSRRVADGDLTTPRDFALLCRYLLLHTDVLKYTSVRQREFGLARTQGPIKMENHNKLLGKVAGVDGLKTGYTEAAGYCLSATAERNGRRVIVVIMGAFGPGGRADYGRSRDVKTVELMEKGFAALPAGSANFATERAKYVQPALIPLDHTVNPAPAITPAATPPADAAASGPSIKFSLPPKR